MQQQKTDSPDLVPVSEILPVVIARIPGMGGYLRKLEQEHAEGRDSKNESSAESSAPRGAAA